MNHLILSEKDLKRTQFLSATEQSGLFIESPSIDSNNNGDTSLLVSDSGITQSHDITIQCEPLTYKDYLDNLNNVYNPISPITNAFFRYKDELDIDNNFKNNQNAYGGKFFKSFSGYTFNLNNGARIFINNFKVKNGGDTDSDKAVIKIGLQFGINYIDIGLRFSKSGLKVYNYKNSSQIGTTIINDFSYDCTIMIAFKVIASQLYISLYYKKVSDIIWTLGFHDNNVFYDTNIVSDLGISFLVSETDFGHEFKISSFDVDFISDGGLAGTLPITNDFSEGVDFNYSILDNIWEDISGIYSSIPLNALPLNKCITVYEYNSQYSIILYRYFINGSQNSKVIFMLYDLISNSIINKKELTFTENYLNSAVVNQQKYSHIKVIVNSTGRIYLLNFKMQNSGSFNFNNAGFLQLSITYSDDLGVNFSSIATYNLIRVSGFPINSGTNPIFYIDKIKNIDCLISPDDNKILISASLENPEIWGKSIFIDSSNNIYIMYKSGQLLKFSNILTNGIIWQSKKIYLNPNNNPFIYVSSNDKLFVFPNRPSFDKIREVNILTGIETGLVLDCDLHFSPSYFFGNNYQITDDGTFLYILENTSPSTITIHKYDMSTGVHTSATTSGYSQGDSIKYHTNTGLLYIACNRNSPSASGLIALNTNLTFNNFNIINTFNIGGGTPMIANGIYLFIAQYNSGRIYRVNTSNNNVANAILGYVGANSITYDGTYIAVGFGDLTQAIDYYDTSLTSTTSLRNVINFANLMIGDTSPNSGKVLCAIARSSGDIIGITEYDRVSNSEYSIQRITPFIGKHFNLLLEFDLNTFLTNYIDNIFTTEKIGSLVGWNTLELNISNLFIKSSSSLNNFIFCYLKHDNNNNNIYFYTTQIDWNGTNFIPTNIYTNKFTLPYNEINSPIFVFSKKVQNLNKNFFYIYVNIFESAMDKILILGSDLNSDNIWQLLKVQKNEINNYIPVNSFEYLYNRLTFLINLGNIDGFSSGLDESLLFSSRYRNAYPNNYIIPPFDINNLDLRNFIITNTNLITPSTPNSYITDFDDESFILTLTSYAKYNNFNITYQILIDNINILFNGINIYFYDKFYFGTNFYIKGDEVASISPSEIWKSNNDNNLQRIVFDATLNEGDYLKYVFNAFALININFKHARILANDTNIWTSPSFAQDLYSYYPGEYLFNVVSVQGNYIKINITDSNLFKYVGSRIYITSGALSGYSYKIINCDKYGIYVNADIQSLGLIVTDTIEIVIDRCFDYTSTFDLESSIKRYRYIAIEIPAQRTNEGYYIIGKLVIGLALKLKYTRNTKFNDSFNSSIDLNSSSGKQIYPVKNSNPVYSTNLLFNQLRKDGKNELQTFLEYIEYNLYNFVFLNDITNKNNFKLMRLYNDYGYENMLGDNSLYKLDELELMEEL